MQFFIPSHNEPHTGQKLQGSSRRQIEKLNSTRENCTEIITTEHIMISPKLSITLKQNNLVVEPKWGKKFK